MVITNDLDLNVGQISLTFRNGKLNLRFESIVTASSATIWVLQEDIGQDIEIATPGLINFNLINFKLNSHKH